MQLTTIKLYKASELPADIKTVIAALDEQGYLFYADGHNYLPA